MPQHTLRRILQACTPKCAGGPLDITVAVHGRGALSDMWQMRGLELQKRLCGNACAFPRGEHPDVAIGPMLPNLHLRCVGAMPHHAHHEVTCMEPCVGHVFAPPSIMVRAPRRRPATSDSRTGSGSSNSSSRHRSHGWGVWASRAWPRNMTRRYAGWRIDTTIQHVVA